MNPTPEEITKYQVKAFQDAYDLGMKLAKDYYENQR